MPNRSHMWRGFSSKIILPPSSTSFKMGWCSLRPTCFFVIFRVSFVLLPWCLLIRYSGRQTVWLIGLYFLLPSTLKAGPSIRMRFTYRLRRIFHFLIFWTVLIPELWDRPYVQKKEIWQKKNIEWIIILMGRRKTQNSIPIVLKYFIDFLKKF